MSNEEDEISRREAIKRVGLTAGALVTLPILSGSRSSGSAAVLDQQPPQQVQSTRFFDRLEYRTVSAMTERIIPTDDSSPGAIEARVPEYIDLVISSSPEGIRVTWREGLASINRKSRTMFGKDFADASDAQQIELLGAISRNESAPQTSEERFFGVVKTAAIEGYYTSEIGIRTALGYKGNAVLKEFPGCTHPEHQR